MSVAANGQGVALPSQQVSEVQGLQLVAVRPALVPVEEVHLAKRKDSTRRVLVGVLAPPTELWEVVVPVNQ